MSPRTASPQLWRPSKSFFHCDSRTCSSLRTTSSTTRYRSYNKSARFIRRLRDTSLLRPSEWRDAWLSCCLSLEWINLKIYSNRRRRSRSRGSRNQHQEDVLDERLKSPHESRTMLMTNSEAIHSLYGEISTERDGDLTHQCIQTNLADVICGGNPNDKILYPRSAKRRSASFPTPRSLERRHSLRLFGSTKRLQRCQSTKSLTKNSTTLQPNQSTSIVTDSSSSEYQSTDSSSPSECCSLAPFKGPIVNYVTWKFWVDSKLELQEFLDFFMEFQESLNLLLHKSRMNPFWECKF